MVTALQWGTGIAVLALIAAGLWATLDDRAWVKNRLAAFVSGVAH